MKHYKSILSLSFLYLVLGCLCYYQGSTTSRNSHAERIPIFGDWEDNRQWVGTKIPFRMDPEGKNLHILSLFKLEDVTVRISSTPDGEILYERKHTFAPFLEMTIQLDEVYERNYTVEFIHPTNGVLTGYIDRNNHVQFR